MKTWQIILIIAIIVVAGIVAILWAKKSGNKDDESKVSNNTEQNSNQSNSNQANTNQSNTNMPEPIDIKNKFVTLSIAGYGDVKVELYEEDAPKTVENFLRLTQSGYYDGISFHRISKGFVIQGGDPTGTGSGGESAFGGNFEDELNPDTASYRAGYLKGVLAMANRGEDTNSSQFFIMLADTPLPHNYTIFGKVVAGQDIVDKIGAVPITPQMGPNDGAPKDKIVITKATISDK